MTLINAAAIVKKNYRLACESELLAGYVDKNFLIKTKQGEKFILKLSQAPSELLEAQNSLLGYIDKRDPSLNVQKVVPANNHLLLQNEIEGEAWNIRLLTYLEGQHFAEVNHTKGLMESLGGYLGRLTNAMNGFSHPEFKARTLEWDIQRTLLNRKYLDKISAPQDRKWVQYYMLQFNELVVPLLPDLRHSVIYGDANDRNILIKNESVNSVIDFGDAVYSQVINELAIAITYAVMGKEDPLGWAIPIVKGFHSQYPLEKNEIAVLYYLVAARLCISVCQSAKSKIEDPDNEYITVSEKPAWDLIRKWGKLNPGKVAKSFYQICGFSTEKTKSGKEITELRAKHISKTLSLSYRHPIQMESAAFQFMFDSGGKTYLDLVNNIMHVGHCHPKVVEAGRRQMAKLNTNTRYHYDLLTIYAENLCNYLPAKLNKIFLVNSGSAASDLAIRLAKNYTGRDKVMVMDHGYHGNTIADIEISPYKYQGKGGFPQSDKIIKASMPDEYRFKGKVEEFINEAKSQIDRSEKSISAFIVEPIVGCGGQVPLPRPYLKELFQHIKINGCLAIADEVQTGFGRVGTHFWAFEQQDAVPDILVLGKPIGNGHPLAAVITTPEIAGSFENGMEFFSSFGGNPVSCAIGNAVLEVIKEEELQSNALAMGSKMLQLLKELQSRYPMIGDVRGSGLFLGIELIRNENLDPATDGAKILINNMKDRGVLLSTDGPFNNVIKIKPPLCIDESDIDFFLNNLDKELQSLSEEFK